MAKKKKANYYDKTMVSGINQLLSDRKYDVALEKAEEYIDKYPNDDVGIYYLAKVYLYSGDSAKALDIVGSDFWYRNFYDESARNLAAVIYASILKACERYDDAIKVLESAIEANPDGSAIRMRKDYLKLLMLKGENVEALKKVNEYLLQNHSPALYYCKGRILFSLGRYQEAIDAFKTSNTHHNLPFDEQKNNYYLGRSYFELFKDKHSPTYINNAEDYFQKSLSVKGPMYYCACGELSNIYNHLGKTDDAIKYANEVIKNKGALKNPTKEDEDYRGLSSAYMIDNKFDKAFEYIGKIGDEVVRNLALLRYYYATKQYDKFLEIIESVLIVCDNRHYIKLYQDYICTLIRVGRYDEAIYKLNNMKEVIDEQFYERVLAFIRFKRGEEHPLYQDYASKQTANYSLEETIKHVCRCQINGRYLTRFTDENNVREAIMLAQDLIKDMDYVPEALVNYYTIVKVGVGNDKYGKVNGMVATTIPDTHNIITLYPVSRVNLSDFEEEYVSKDVKRLTQIEKFNLKYGKK